MARPDRWLFSIETAARFRAATLEMATNDVRDAVSSVSFQSVPVVCVSCSICQKGLQADLRQCRSAGFWLDDRSAD